VNFHHPYHFVPVEPPSGNVSRSAFENGAPTHVTHGRYAPDTWSGRIVCRLETVSPMFIGSTRHEEDDKPVKVKVDNYTLAGQIAIPASSLRGTLSSIAEAASDSAMRVFDSKAHYSVRKPMEPEHVLSAIGVVLGDKASGFQLQPLCIPTLRADRDGFAALPKPFWSLFPEPNLKVYVGDSRSIRRDSFPFRTFDMAKPEWFALPLETRKWLPGYRLADDRFQYRKPVSTRGYVLGQTPLEGAADPVPIEEAKRLDEDRRRTWKPGVMRVLGCWGNREAEIPPGKKHEVFLPWPERPDWPVVEIPGSVVDEFHELCAARMEASLKAHERDPRKNPLLPFEPRDTRPGRESKSTPKAQRLILLKKGDLVYFGVDERGTINEISFSAIWRKTVRNGTDSAKASEFFPAELSPFSHTRGTVSPAELLFGFVEDVKGRPAPPPPAKPRQALALASRVRTSAALPSGPVRLLDEVTLKVLDAPKPPCPSLYFKPRGNPNGEFIPKMKLDARLHEAQGRKFYLHQPPQTEPWRSVSKKAGPDAKEVNKDQQCRINPIAAGQSFYFHLDFDNLSDAEIGLLLYSLSPSERFLHKIGMGKGIGLGSVRISPMALLRVDRARRYTPEGLAGPRYHQALLAPAALAHWDGPYAAEKLAASSAPASDLLPIRDAFRNGMNPNIRQAIELIGDPANVKAPVLPPLIQGQTDPELETFKWFVANETGLVDRAADREIPAQKQFLRPLVNRRDLPVFIQPAWMPRRRR
jgi:CRISPR-associated protein (TIGR03986 family)